MKALILLAAIAMAAAQTRCKPPPTFETRGIVTYEDHERRGMGEFGWAHDVSVGKAAEEVRFEERFRHLDMWFLEDYANHKRYEEDTVNRTCVVRALNGTIQDIWAWLATASFIGSRDWRGRTIDIWGTKLPHGQEIDVGCFSTDPTRPIAMFETLSDGANRTLEFTMFNPSITNTSIFRPLPNCPMQLRRKI